MKRLWVPALLLIFVLTGCGAEKEKEQEAAETSEEAGVSEEQEEEQEMEEPETAGQGIYDYPAMIMVDDVLYYDSGEISTAARCGSMDGEIKEVIGGVPVENGQSNFAEGLGYQYGAGETIEVNREDGWHIFVKYESGGPEEDWDSLTEQEKMERDPNYIPDH